MSVLKVVLRHSNRFVILVGITFGLCVLKVLEDNAPLIKRDIVLTNTTDDQVEHIRNFSASDSSNCSTTVVSGSSQSIGVFVSNISAPTPGEQCKKRLPTALVVGIQKCGTSALLYFLSRHPEISAVLHPSEVNYFSHKFKIMSLDSYRETMNCSYSNQISIEKSPSYFYHQESPARIKEVNSNMKIIIIVKDPIVRTLSAYAMRKDNYGNTTKPIEDVVLDSTGKIKTTSSTMNLSLYPRRLKRWIETFAMSQIHFVDGLNLENNPTVELNLVERFMGIGSYFTSDHFVFNATKGKYCLNTSTGMECLKDAKGRKHEELSEDVLRKLQDFFRPINEKFFELANRTFSWGY